MRIGLVDIDTSHPASWIPLIRHMGHDIVAIWDGGSVHSRPYVQAFAQEHGIPPVLDSLGDMVDRVDIAIVHSCNWDLHIQRATPFIEAEKSVLIDKPLAGCYKDIQQLITWADNGKRIAGGSSLRTAIEIKEFLAKPVDERGEVRIAFAGCGIDEFSYGIHAYSTLCSVMGHRATTVRWLADTPQCQVEVVWDENRRGIVSVGGAQGWLPSYATIVTDKTIEGLTVNTMADPLYKIFLETVMPYLCGQTEQPPMPIRQLVEPELIAIAALESHRRDGQVVHISELTEEMPGYNGDAFAIDYKAQRGD